MGKIEKFIEIFGLIIVVLIAGSLIASFFW